MEAVIEKRASADWRKPLIEYAIYGVLFSLCLLGSGSLCSRSSLCLGRRLAATAGLLGSLARLGHVLIEVNEFDEANRGSIAQAMAKFDDTGIATGTVAYLLGYRAEKFFERFLVLEVTEHHAA